MEGKIVEGKKGGRGKGEMVEKKYKMEQNYRPRNHCPQIDPIGSFLTTWF
jgi:hypothetical protein